jgi:hypothetical protein
VARDGDLSAAIELIKPLDVDQFSKWSHHEAKLKCYRWAASHQRKAGDPDGAKRILRELAAQCDWIGDPDGLFRFVIWVDVVRDLAEGGLVDEAIRLAAKVVDPTGQARTLAGLAFSRAESGDSDNAKRLIAMALQAMEKSSVEALWESEHSPRGRYFSEEIENSPRSGAWLYIIDAQVRVGDAAAARKTAAGLSTNSLDLQNQTTALARIAEIQAMMTDFSGALATLEKASADTELDIEPRKSEALARIARLQAEAGDAAGVFTWAQKIDNE